MADHLLNVGIAHIHTNDNPAFGSVTINLERSVHQFDAGYFTNRQLNVILSTDKQFVDVQVTHLFLVQTDNEVEPAFVLEDHSCRLACISSTDNSIQFFDINTITGYFCTVVVDKQLWKSHGLFHQYVGCSGNLFHVAGCFLSLCIQFGHVFSIKFDGNIGLGTCHQLVKTKLDRLTEVKFGSVNRVQTLFHLLYHLCTARRGSPFGKRFHNNHHIGIFHRHRVGRNFGRTDLGYNMLDFGKAFFETFFCFERNFNATAQRTTSRQRHLHGKVAFVKGRDKFGSQLCEKQQRKQQGNKRSSNSAPHMSQTETKHTLIDFIQPVEETVGQCRLHRHGTFQEEGCHHRNISYRKKKSTDNAEHQCLGHRREVFAFDTGQSQDREEHDQNDKYGKRSTSHHTACTFFYFLIHLLRSQRTSFQFPPVKMGQNSFQNNNGTVYHDTEVYRTKTHQVGRYIKYTHQNKSEKHR